MRQAGSSANILFRAPELRERLGDRAALVFFLMLSSTLRFPMRSPSGSNLYKLVVGVDDSAVDRYWAQAKLPHRRRRTHPGALLRLRAQHQHRKRRRPGREARHHAQQLGRARAARQVRHRAQADSRGPERGQPQSPAHPAQAGAGPKSPGRPEGERARAEMAQRLESSGVQREFYASEIHFGLRYRSPTVIEDPDAAMRPGKPDADWRPAASPATAPRTRGGNASTSTLDLFGHGFVLDSPQCRQIGVLVASRPSASRSAGRVTAGRSVRGSRCRDRRRKAPVVRRGPRHTCPPACAGLSPQPVGRCLATPRPDHAGAGPRTVHGVAATALMMPPTPDTRSPHHGCLLNQQTPASAAMGQAGVAVSRSPFLRKASGFHQAPVWWHARWLSGPSSPALRTIGCSDRRSENRDTETS